MTQDLNKGISSITYNELNLPMKMTIKTPELSGTTEYSYTATGAKLQVVHKWTSLNAAQQSSSSTSNTKTTDYAGNKIYENGKLKMILTDNGYIENEKYYFYIKDHLGNNRIVADQSANVIQTTEYYPYGMPFSKDDTQPFKYNNKELDNMNGLNWYDYSARHYDATITRFTTIDPHAEKYYSISPYVYCANNPVIYVDPTGMDWYTDNDGNYQYDPNLTAKNQSEILKKGQVYVGVTHQVKDAEGNVIENYRKDGSIMFANETSAYKRIWKQANKVNREQLAVIKNENVLVLPEYLNNNTTAKTTEYGYIFKDSKLFDPVTNSESSMLATIHTHQDDLDGKWGFVAPSGFEDDIFFTYNTPNIPYFTMGYDKKIYGKIGNFDKYNITNLQLPPKYTVDYLLSGAKFRLLIKTNISKK
jgi:RHS repeat-associated protein